nr:c-type cytochrome [Candidatus Dadabacteria bacterium]NIQ14113.1 c-type cytochrome [Candidatus Dadabacteria bacterium]
MIYNNTAKLTVFLFIGIFVLTQISFSQETAGGNSIFVQSRCANCHTIGRGRFVGPDLIKVGDRYSRGEIVNWAVNSQLVYTEKGKMPVNDGYPPMPPMNIDKDIAEKIADYLINYKVKPGLSAKGTIKGQIINKTQNMKAKDVDVLLTSYLGDKKIESKFEFTDKNGLFSFTGLDWDKSYEITVIYNKAEYVSNKMVFPPNQDLIHLELPVFDTTDSDEKLYINNLHTIVYNSPKENYANITNIYELINSGDRIFIGTAFDGKEKGVLAKTVSFSIPNKAVNINFLNGVNANDIIEDDGKLYDSSAFHPGVKRVVLSYDFPLNKS